MGLGRRQSGDGARGSFALPLHRLAATVRPFTGTIPSNQCEALQAGKSPPALTPPPPALRLWHLPRTPSWPPTLQFTQRTHVQWPCTKYCRCGALGCVRACA